MKKGLHAFLMSKKLRLDGSAAKQPEIKAIHFISYPSFCGITLKTQLAQKYLIYFCANCQN